MRPLPGDSVEYFEEMALGNTAFPGAAGVAAGVAAVLAGAAAASAPHSALRKSRHFCPLSVPASLAALYLTLHSFMVSACALPQLMAMAQPSAAPIAIE